MKLAYELSTFAIPTYTFGLMKSSPRNVIFVLIPSLQVKVTCFGMEKRVFPNFPELSKLHRSLTAFPALPGMKLQFSFRGSPCADDVSGASRIAIPTPLKIHNPIPDFAINDFISMYLRFSDWIYFERVPQQIDCGSRISSKWISLSSEGIANDPYRSCWTCVSGFCSIGNSSVHKRRYQRERHHRHRFFFLWHRVHS
jgi:hypothetical protein